MFFSLFLSALTGCSFFHIRDFDGVITLAESGNMLALPRGVHAFIANVGLFSFLRTSQFDYKNESLAYNRSGEVDGNEKDFNRWFSFVRFTMDTLVITDREILSKKRIASDVQVMSWEGGVPFKLIPGSKNTRENTAHAVSLVIGSLVYVPDPADDMPLSEDHILSSRHFGAIGN